MSTPNKNRVEKWLEENTDHGLPVTGFEIESGRTAIVLTDPQRDFLHPEGVAWGAVGESVIENNTVANMTALMNAAVANDMPPNLLSVSVRKILRVESLICDPAAAGEY